MEPEARKKAVEAARKAAAERRANAPPVEEKSGIAKYVKFIVLAFALYYGYYYITA